MLCLLPDDATRVKAALLAREELECLRGVCREASRDPLLQDPGPRTLILSPTDPANARLLLARISSLHRPAGISAVQVATECHVDLLRQSSLFDHVERVRVRPIDGSNGTTARSICEKLQEFPSLLTLDVAERSFHAVATIASMPQLRELTLTRTNVHSVDALSTLTKLQKLVLEETNVTDLSCIHAMLELRDLCVLRQRPGRNHPVADVNRFMMTYIPPLHIHTKLRRLELEACTMQSTADLFSIAGGLQTLRLTNVQARRQNRVEDEATGLLVNVDEIGLLNRLTQLETIRLVDSVSILGVTDEGAVESLARIPSLRAIQHPIESNLPGLAPLVELEELELHLCTTYVDRGRELEDFTVLLHLPLLKKLKIRHNGHVSYPMPLYIPSEEYENIKWEARSFTDVLEKLTGLESLEYEGYIDSVDVLPQLTRLKHLSLSRITPQIEDFDWITQLHGLRSLTIQTDTRKCDHSAIGHLTQLEELSIVDCDVYTYCEDDSSFQFLSTLVNLRKLHLQGRHVHDLGSLCGLTRLTTLTIQSTCKRAPTSNFTSLSSLINVREQSTSVDDFTPLRSLPSLRSVTIPDISDCSQLVSCAPPKLLRVSHRGQNCLWSAPHSTP